MRTRQAVARQVLARYALTWCYLAVFGAAEIVYALLPGHDQSAVLAWASTNVHNLAHNPVGSMIASAFFATGALTAWPLLIPLGMTGANAVLGNWRLAVTCIAGHVIGTLVSEGILWYQIAHGTRPAADRFIIDVGPSYIVVAAIAVGLLWGSWLGRLAAAVAFGVLVFVGQIFSGLSHLEVSAVGHLTALLTGCVLGSLLARQRRARARPLGPRHGVATVGVPAAADGDPGSRAGDEEGPTRRGHRRGGGITRS
jgi:rhomboid family protein